MDKGPLVAQSLALVSESVISARNRLQPIDSPSNAIGAQQFDIVKFRLQTEYGCKTATMPLSQSLIAWVKGDLKELDSFYMGSDIRRLVDTQGRTDILFNSQFQMNHMAGRAKGFQLLSEPEGQPIGI